MLSQQHTSLSDIMLQVKIHGWLLGGCIPALLTLEACGSGDARYPEDDLNSLKCACYYHFTEENEGVFFTEDFIKDLTDRNPVKANHIESAHFYEYNWEAEGLIHSVGFIQMETKEKLMLNERSPKVEINNIVAQYVKATYRNRSEKDLAKLYELLEEDANLPDKEIIQNPKWSSKEQGLALSHNAYVEIAHVNDFTVYNQKTFKLHTVVGNIHLVLTARVGPYGEVNEAKSVELARRLALKVGSFCNTK